MAPLVLAPQRAGLPITPYLTVAEFKAEPTGVEVSDLVPGGNQTQQDAALARKIAQASSWMDGFVHYVLGATVDTESGRFRVNRDGIVMATTRAIPILEVDTFSVGVTPSTMTAITQAPDAWIEDNVIAMPVWAAVPGGRTLSPIGVGGLVYCQWTYVNGYANTLLSNSPLVGATSVQVSSGLGIYPGTQLSISDPNGNSESITVDPSYQSVSTPVPATIPLLSGTTLQFAHSSGISISALPPRVKQAAVLATRAFITTRSAGAMTAASIEGAPQEKGEEGGAIEDLALAETLLQPLVLPVW